MSLPRPSRCLPCLLTCVLAQAQESKPDAPFRATVQQTVQQAIEWIGRQSAPVEGTPGAVLFPDTAESDTAPPAAQVYGGTAGVLVFLENAALVLKDERARTLADATARGLVATRRKDAGGRFTWMPKGMTEGAAALYVGDAGVGHAFLVRARVRGDKEALATAVEVGDALLARAEKDGDELHWDRQVEMIYGAAGTTLFLLELGTETGEKRFVDGALAACRWLIGESRTAASKADPKKTLRSWRWQLGGNRHYPNFSHGTAGIAYALARVGAATKDKACAEAARDGAEWLLEHAIREAALVRFPVVEGTDRSMGGWCHGPPGTARLFLLLHRQTGEQRYLDTALASARWVMAQAPADAGTGSAPAPEFPPSLCCGVAGVVDFFCDLHRATGNPEFAAFAQRAGHYLIRLGVRDGEGIKWRNGTSHRGGAVAEHGIDLMLGASGEALVLLRLLTLGDKVDPVRHLPDRSVGLLDSTREPPAMPRANELTVTRTGEREVTVRRSFQAPRSAVFAALTTPALIKQWLSAAGRELTTCEVDLRPGGEYRYVFTAANGREFTMYGTFKEVVPGERIVHTESYVGLAWKPLVTTVRLTEHAGGTAMETHILYPTKQVCDTDAPNQEQGAAEVYARLDRLLAAPSGGTTRPTR